MRGFQADWICPVVDPPIRNGVLVVDEDRIVEVLREAPEGLLLESFPGCGLIPGFVNTHTHLELTILRGFLENLPFHDWIHRLTVAKYENLTRDDLLVSARLGAAECLAAGVTAVGEVMDVGTGWQAMVETGLRGVAFQEVFGPQESVADESLVGLERKVAAHRQSETDIRRIGLSPHAPYTVSPQLFRLVSDLAEKESLPISVHIAESEAEVRFVLDGAGPFAESWVSRKIPVFGRGVSPVQFLADLGLLSPRLLAVHAIETDERDIEILQSSGVSIAHCPKSNAKLGHAIAPLLEFFDAGITVGLGTDSVASNNVIDMFEEMRTAIFLQRTRLGDPSAIGADKALRMATLDAARCLGVDQHIGSLEKGKLADIVAVELSDPALQPVYDPVAAMVYSGNRKNIKATFMGGERVFLDATDTMRRAQDIGERLKSVSAEH